jgi:hypothetical protein
MILNLTSAFREQNGTNVVGKQDINVRYFAEPKQQGAIVPEPFTSPSEQESQPQQNPLTWWGVLI